MPHNVESLYGNPPQQSTPICIAQPNLRARICLPVVLEIGGETFAGEKALLYKAKAGKFGSAK